jgi:2-keto-3-deoxy-L-fuconate dehydrogenase
MAERLDGKRVVVTDSTEYNGADIVDLFREEGATVFADSRDLTIQNASDDLIREAGHIDILIANLAYPHRFARVEEQSDEDLEYAVKRLVYPLHRLTRAVLPQMMNVREARS